MSAMSCDYFVIITKGPESKKNQASFSAVVCKEDGMFYDLVFLHLYTKEKHKLFFCFHVLVSYFSLSRFSCENRFTKL